MDFSLPGSSIHGIFQASVLEWVAIAVSDDQRRQHIKKQRHHFADKDPYGQNCSFSSSLSTEELMLLNCGVGERLKAGGEGDDIG